MHPGMHSMLLLTACFSCKIVALQKQHSQQLTIMESPNRELKSFDANIALRQLLIVYLT